MELQDRGREPSSQLWFEPGLATRQGKELPERYGAAQAYPNLHQQHPKLASLHSRCRLFGITICNLPTSRSLHPDRHVYQRQRRRSHAGNPARLSNGAGPHALQLLPHLAGKPADHAVVDPFRDSNRFRDLELLDRLLLLIEITSELDLRLDGARL